MQKLFVYADFNWLDTPRLIGELTAEKIKTKGRQGKKHERIDHPALSAP